MEQIKPGKFKHSNGIVEKVDTHGVRLDHKDPDTGAAYSEYYKDGDLWRATCVSHMQLHQVNKTPWWGLIEQTFPSKSEAKLFLDDASKLPGATQMDPEQLALDGARRNVRKILKEYFEQD